MLEDLIELAENEVPITMSSLINTVFDTPDKVLKRIENGFFSYENTTKMNYKFSSMLFVLNMKSYILFVINYNSKKKEKIVQLDDQVIIIKIKVLDYEKAIVDKYTNYKYTD